MTTILTILHATFRNDKPKHFSAVLAVSQIIMYKYYQVLSSVVKTISMMCIAWVNYSQTYKFWYSNSKYL